MKFSLKKGGGGDKAAKPAKPAKRASRSGGREGTAAIKAFFVNHLEKLLLTAIALLAVMIIYSGFRKPGLNSDPGKLTAEINAARTNMNASTWTEVSKQRQPEPDTFDVQATADTVSIKDEDFQLPTPVHPILKERAKRRTDPQLLAPTELEVRAGYGPLAVRAAEAPGAATPAIPRTERGSAETRPLPEKLRQRYRGGSPGGDSPTVSAFFVSLTGLVPIKQQAIAYREAFEGAAEFLAERDTPRYLALSVQRAEVGANGQPGEWTDLDALRVMRLEPARWESHLEETAEPDYVIAPLVMPLPPLRFRDVTQWSAHSKIPQQKLGPGGVLREAERPTESDTAPAADQPVDLFGGMAAGTRGESREGPRTTAESTGDEKVPAEGALIENRIKIDNGLLRYFDFTVEPGKAYVYRVRLLLEDPNNPKEFTRPAASSCETSVVVRRQADPTKYYQESPWSEASSSVAVPTGQMVLAGSVVQPKMYPVSEENKRIRLPRRPDEESEATVMAVVWDRNKGMDVPAPIRVRRGAVINDRLTTEAVDPAKSNIIKLEDYPLQTNTIVLDIAGGESLDPAAKLRAPGLLLLMDANGQLVSHHEVLDFDQFDSHVIPEDEDVIAQREREAQQGPEAVEDRGRGPRGEARGGIEEAPAEGGDAVRPRRPRGGGR